MKIKSNYLFWKVGAATLLLLFALTFGLVQTARSANQHVCMRLYATDATHRQNMGIADLAQRRFMADRRPQSTGILESAPNRKLWAGYRSSGYKSREGDLVVQPLLSPYEAPQFTLIQPGIIENYQDASQLNHVLWSPDSSQIAYMWADDKELFLTVATVDGKQRRTAFVMNDPPTPLRTSVTMGSWSPDGKYFTVGRAKKHSQTILYELWDATTLQRINNNQFLVGDWAPQGNHFAGLRLNKDDKPVLVIWTPEHERAIPINIHSSVRAVQITWSPGGQYIMLHSTKFCQRSKGCSRQWRFDIWDRAGQLVAGNITGGALLGDPLLASYTFVPPNSAWIADDQKLVFVRTDSNSDTPHHDLVALHLPTGDDEVLATDLMEDSIHRVFRSDTPLFSTLSLRKVAKAAGNRMIITTQRDEKMRIELSDLDGSNRLTLVDGAAQLLFPAQAFFGNPFWTQNGMLIVIPWSSDKSSTKDAHLTWLRNDSTEVHQIDGLDDIQRYTVVLSIDQFDDSLRTTPQAIAYLTRYQAVGDKYALEVVGIDSHKPVRLLENRDRYDLYDVRLSPVHNIMALVIGPQIYQTNSSRQALNDLYLFFPDTKQIKHVASGMFASPHWSPDGKRLAYLSYHTNQKKAFLNSITTEGDLVSSVEVEIRDQLSLWGWSRCD